MKEKSVFAERLTARRIELKYTQESFAEIVGMSRARYANYEQSRREPDLDIVNLFAKHLNTTTDYLLGRDTDKPARPRPTQEEKDEIMRLFDTLSEEEQTAFLKKLLLRPKKEN